MQATKRLDAFKVVGIAVRTSNRNGQSQKDISELWQRFAGENLIDKIPGKINSDIYCIYTDYENAANGMYTTILGCRVNSVEKLPEAFISKTIPAGDYSVYTSIGKLPDAVVKTWMGIWESGVQRKFVADFDVYGEKAQDPEHAEVDTYVS